MCHASISGELRFLSSISICYYEGGQAPGSKWWSEYAGKATIHLVISSFGCGGKGKERLGVRTVEREEGKGLKITHLEMRPENTDPQRLFPVWTHLTACENNMNMSTSYGWLKLIRTLNKKVKMNLSILIKGSSQFDFAIITAIIQCSSLG